jgi:hypothetical protein
MHSTQKTHEMLQYSITMPIVENNIAVENIVRKYSWNSMSYIFHIRSKSPIRIRALNIGATNPIERHAASDKWSNTPLGGE